MAGYRPEPMSRLSDDFERGTRITLTDLKDDRGPARTVIPAAKALGATILGHRTIT